MTRTVSKQCFAIGLLASSLFLGSCEKSKTEENEEELITTVVLVFTESGTTNTTTAIFRDPDGEGGNPPTQFDPISLKAGKTYNVAIQLLNESVTPPENITDEVEEESDEHQFYYIPSGVGIAVSNLDTDGNGWPLGILSTWTTSGAGNGSVRIVLKHKPNGQKGPNDPVSLGETDIDLTFNATVTL